MGKEFIQTDIGLSFRDSMFPLSPIIHMPCLEGLHRFSNGGGSHVNTGHSFPCPMKPDSSGFDLSILEVTKLLMHPLRNFDSPIRFKLSSPSVLLVGCSDGLAPWV